MALAVAYSREEAFEKIKKSGKVLEYLDDNLRADRELVLEAVKRHGLSLKFASKEMRADKVRRAPPAYDRVLGVAPLICSPRVRRRWCWRR